MEKPQTSNKKVPLTDAERQRRYIEKIKKEGKYDILKKRRAEYEKEKRKKAKDLLKNCSKFELMEKLSVSRAKDRERQRRYRQMKREQRILSIISTLDGNERAESKSPTDFPNIFDTEHCTEKAINKAKRALPASPSKKKTVIAELLTSLDEDAQRDIICNTAIIKKNIPNEKRIEFFDAVQKFFEREDLSGLSLDSDDEDAKPFSHVVKEEEVTTEVFVETIHPNLTEMSEFDSRIWCPEDEQFEIDIKRDDWV